MKTHVKMSAGSGPQEKPGSHCHTIKSMLVTEPPTHARFIHMVSRQGCRHSL